MSFKNKMHIGIMSENTNRLCRWYEEKLNFKKVHVLPATEKRSEVYWLEFEGNVIEIVPANNTVRAKRSIKDPGLSHYSITVKDFDKIMADLKEKKIEINNIHVFNDFRCGFFSDLEGNLVEILSFNK